MQIAVIFFPLSWQPVTWIGSVIKDLRSLTGRRPFQKSQTVCLMRGGSKKTMALRGFPSLHGFDFHPLDVTLDDKGIPFESSLQPH